MHYVQIISLECRTTVDLSYSEKSLLFLCQGIKHIRGEVEDGGQCLIDGVYGHAR